MTESCDNFSEKKCTTVVENINFLKEEIENENFKIELIINGGSYIDTKNTFSKGMQKYTRKVNKMLLINGSIKLNANQKSEIKLKEIDGKNKNITIVYNIVKIGDKFQLTIFKSFGEYKGELQIDTEYIEIKKGNNNYTIKFERTGIGGYEKDIGNLELNLTIKGH